MIARITKPARANSRRTQERLKRILILIDLLAPCRRFHSADFIRQRINERTSGNWCERTIRRDLELLADLGLAEVGTMPNQGKLEASTGFRLKLRATESHQTMALML